MKRKIIIILMWYQHSIISSSTQRNCPSCSTTLQECRTYIEQLEKRIKVLHDDVARWMKLYAEEIATKASCLEKNMTNIIDMTAKFISLEQKVTKTK